MYFSISSIFTIISLSFSKSWSCRLLNKKIHSKVRETLCILQSIQRSRTGRLCFLICVDYVLTLVRISWDELFIRLSVLENFSLGFDVGVICFAGVKTISSWAIRGFDFFACLGKISKWVNHRWADIFLGGSKIVREYIKSKFYVDIELWWLHMFVFL